MGEKMASLGQKKRPLRAPKAISDLPPPLLRINKQSTIKACFCQIFFHPLLFPNTSKMNGYDGKMSAHITMSG